MANGEWQVGDRAVGIPVSGGWVYVNQAALDYYGEDFFKQINGSVDTVVTAG